MQIKMDLARILYIHLMRCSPKGQWSGVFQVLNVWQLSGIKNKTFEMFPVIKSRHISDNTNTVVDLISVLIFSVAHQFPLLSVLLKYHHLMQTTAISWPHYYYSHENDIVNRMTSCSSITSHHSIFLPRLLFPANSLLFNFRFFFLICL